MATAQRGAHARHPIRDEERRELKSLMREDKFKQAFRAYKLVGDKYHVPYLGGSSNDGRTVYCDPTTPKDVRKFIFVHEAVEGVLIRKYGFSYTKAHRFATLAERYAVENNGLDWDKYENRLAPIIAKDEHARVKNTPPDLLLEPYKGEPIMAKLKAAERKALPKSDFGLPGEKKYPMPDRSHAANAKSRAKQMLNRAVISKSAYDRVVAKANRKLGEG